MKQVFEYVKANNMIGPVVVHIPPLAYKESLLGYSVGHIFRQLLQKPGAVGGYAVALGAFINTDEDNIKPKNRISGYKNPAKAPKKNDKQQKEIEDESFFMKLNAKDVFKEFKGVGPFKLFAFLHIEVEREPLDIRSYLLENIASNHPVIKRWRKDLLKSLDPVSIVDIVKSVSMVFSDVCNSEHVKAYLFAQALLGYCLENKFFDAPQNMSVMMWPFLLRTDVNPVIPTLDMTAYRRAFGDRFTPEMLYKVLSMVSAYGTITNVSPVNPDARFLPDFSEGLLTTNKIIYDKILPPKEKTETMMKYFDIYNRTISKAYLTFVESHVIKRVSSVLSMKVGGSDRNVPEMQGFNGKFIPALRVMSDAIGMANMNVMDSRPVVRLWYPSKMRAEDGMSLLAIPNTFELWSVLQHVGHLKAALTRARKNYASRKSEIHFTTEEQEKACDSVMSRANEV